MDDVAAACAAVELTPGGPRPCGRPAPDHTFAATHGPTGQTTTMPVCTEHYQALVISLRQVAAETNGHV